MTKRVFACGLCHTTGACPHTIGAPAALAQVTDEARAEEPPMLPASIDALIEQIEGAAVDFGAAELNSMAEELAHQEGEAAKRALRAELDAAVKRAAAEHEEAAVLATMADDDESADAHRAQARALCRESISPWAARVERIGCTCTPEDATLCAAGRTVTAAGLMPCGCACHGAPPEPRPLPRHLTAPANVIDAIGIVSLLALGDRDKTSDEERKQIVAGLIGYVQRLHEELDEQRKRHLQHRNDLYKALSDRDGWRARAEVFERDFADAAGELLVDIRDCRPGTVAGKLLSANVLMRRELERLRPTPRPPIAAGHCCACDADPCVCHEAGLP